MEMEYDYLDALSAIKATFTDANLFLDYTAKELALFAFGWLTAKGVACDLSALEKAIIKDVFNNYKLK